MFSLKSKDIFCNAFAPKKLASVGSLLFLLFVGTAFVCLAQIGGDTDNFPVPDSYRVEGIPPIKNSGVEDLFYDPASIRSNLIWDADKKNKRLLVTDATNNIYLLNTPLSQPVKLIDKIIPNSVRVRPNGESFAYTSDHEDEDNYQLYLYDFKEKTSRKLISLTGKDESVDSFLWSESGDSLFFAKVDYDAKTSKICRYDFLAENCYPVELKGVWNVIQMSGKTILLKYSKGSSSQLLYVYDFAANKLISVEEKGNSRKSFLVSSATEFSGRARAMKIAAMSRAFCP